MLDLDPDCHVPKAGLRSAEVRQAQIKIKTLCAAISFVLILACAGHSVGQRRRTAAKPRPTRSVTADRKQQPPAPPMPVLPDIRNDPEVQAADIAIIANITAEELRFDVVPNATVEFLDKSKDQTIWHADRYNLPDKIEPGVTYRNIGIRLKITSRLADIERIVAEALGEIPISEAAVPKEAAPRPEAETPPDAPAKPLKASSESPVTRGRKPKRK